MSNQDDNTEMVSMRAALTMSEMKNSSADDRETAIDTRIEEEAAGLDFDSRALASSIVSAFYRGRVIEARNHQSLMSISKVLKSLTQINDAETTVHVVAAVVDRLRSTETYDPYDAIGLIAMEKGMKAYADNISGWGGDPVEMSLLDQLIIDPPDVSFVRSSGFPVGSAMNMNAIFRLCESPEEVSMVMTLGHQMVEDKVMVRMDVDTLIASNKLGKYRDAEKVYIEEVRRCISSGIPVEWYIKSSEMIR